MGRQLWKPGNMLYPVPAVMVTCKREGGQPNIITIAWAGTVCSSPAMVSISVRPERYSYDIIKASGEFVINLVTEKLTFATDYCGVKSGRDIDKFKATGLHTCPGLTVATPGIAESPVNIECKVKEVIPLGSHHMFLAEVTGVQVDEAYMNENIKQSVTMTPKMCDEIEKYSLNHHISKSQAIRALLEKALTQDTLVGEQDIIRKYIRDELEVVIPNIREIKDIKEYAQLSSKSSAVAMLCICRVLYDICQDWGRVDEYFARAIVASMSMNGEKPTSVDEQLRFVEGWIKSVFEI